MICSKCSTEIRVRNTYSAKTCKFQRAKCPKCETVYTIYIGIVFEDPKMGDGAGALLKDVMNGSRKVIISVEDSAAIPPRNASGF